MNLNLKSRFSLAALWAMSFFVAISIPFILLVRNTARSESVLASIESVSALYAPYVGAIFAYYFTKGNFVKIVNENKLSLYVALTASFMWNAAFLVMFSQVIWKPIPLIVITEQSVALASKMSWLIAPAIGYYFAADPS